MSGIAVVRAKRVDLSFPLCFVYEGQEIRGNCLNISESGLMANFEQELELWTTGRLQLSFARAAVTVGARVARCVERDAGLSFLFEAESERTAIRALVASAAAQSTLAGGVAPF
ncbi:MAG: PilZ domain-containing protein [Janthinobacterium lividum]